MAKRYSRRWWLKTVAATAGAASTSRLFQAPSVLADPSPNSKLAVAVIGCGGRGEASLARASGEKRVALVDVEDGRLAATARKASEAGATPKTFYDYRRMFDAMHKDIDAVFVATPDHHHAPASMIALRLGKHVFCEKPLCHDISQARALAAAGRAQKVTTMMGNQGHCEASYRRVCEYIWAEAIGDVVETHSWSGFVNGGAGGRPPSKPVPAGLHWDEWLGPAPYRDYHDGLHPLYWRCYWDFGTGGLGDWGCHNLDGVFWALKPGAPASIKCLETIGGSDEKYPQSSISQCEPKLPSGVSAQRLAPSAKLLAACAILAIICHAFQSFAATPTADEMSRQSAWLRGHFGSRAATPAFSFACSGHDADRSLDKWKRTTSTHAFADRTLHAASFTDPQTGLVVRCEVAEFRDHAAVEWVVYLKNTSSADTPILADIRALDDVIPSPSGDAVLHYARGAVCSMDDFAQLTETMRAGTRLHLEPAGGRSSSDFLPFFNLETPSRGGVVIDLGWSGEWAADFIQEGERQTRVQAGMALTHLKLHPGEEIRTPRVALLFYQGDWMRGQNLWRCFVLDQHRPKVNGQPLAPPIFNGNWGGTPAASHLENIKAIVAHDLPMEFYWIDAEWFGRGAWWMNPGDWSVKRDLYPEGFKPISDALHQSGRKLLLWFEPERVCEGTPWFNEHPQWLLEVLKDRRVYNWGDKRTFPDWVISESRRNQIKDGDRLFNLGDPDARQFVTEFFSARITEFGLDCFRHDANIAPLEYWRAADAPDRQGITEIRWVEGLYAFWDELLRRHPGLLIDNCASGGRRIDLETLSRSTPFWRTDFPGDLTGKQCHTYGISSWIPLNSTGGVTLGRDSDYAWRSTISSTVTFGLFGNGDAPQAQRPPADFPFEKAKATLAQYRRLQPYFLGDYYPLTPYTKAAEAWLAWQFHRVDLGGGVVQAFRRPASLQDSARLKLRGLDSCSRYVVTDLDDTKPYELSGRELMMNGLLLTTSEKPSARIVTYRQVQ